MILSPRSGTVRHFAGPLLCAWFFIFAASTYAQQPTPQERARSVEARYAAARTLQARFLERYSRGPGDVTLESGTVYFSRPGRMRWEYESPETKLFLADGKHVWFYVPADRTATRAKTKESADWHTPLALLAGKTRKGMFARMCGRIEAVEPAKAGAGPYAAFAFRCVAKAKDSPFSELLLEGDELHRITRLLIREPGGIETEFRFAEWRQNPLLQEALFHFSAPPGVAIVEEAALAPKEPPAPPKP